MSRSVNRRLNPSHFAFEIVSRTNMLKTFEKKRRKRKWAELKESYVFRRILQFSAETEKGLFVFMLLVSLKRDFA